MKSENMLTIPLSSLIRMYGDNAVCDAISLAKNILAPHKSDLPATIHKFSSDLFVLVITNLAGDKDKTLTLKDVTAYITDAEHSSEREMLKKLVSSASRFNTHAEMKLHAEKFDKTIPTYDGQAMRLVAASNFQWCKALCLPQLPMGSPLYYTAERKPAPHRLSTPSPAQIRINTRFELVDATKIANKFLAPVQSDTDMPTYAFALNLLVLVSLAVAHEKRVPTFDEALSYVVDPAWNSHKQIICHLGQNMEEIGKQKKTAEFREAWFDKTIAKPDSTLKSLIKRSHTLWQQAIAFKGAAVSTVSAKGKAAPTNTPVNSIQVFNLEELGRAQTLMGECEEKRRGGGERILESAQANGGYRTIPDAKKAYDVLEQAKAEFENLIEPLEKLQLNLALAAAMKPENFRVRPILLLGDPGIGKTYLALTLAKSLGGSMEKMSAGGAQAGFQLNGSHSSWTGSRCGQVFRTLAESKTTSPVFVIDEIDKLGSDDRYPMLPVLLDLFEPATAKEFRDEFFEINFDASRLIFILTANDIEFVSPPLLSRVTTFNIQRPEPAQRMRIIENEVKNLCKSTNSKIKLDHVTARELADRVDIDLRITVAITQECFTRALMCNKKTVYLVIGKDVYTGEKPGPYHRSNVGFLNTAKPVTAPNELGRSR